MSNVNLKDETYIKGKLFIGLKKTHLENGHGFREVFVFQNTLSADEALG